VCKTPSPGGPVPIPYPNVAMDGDLAKGAKNNPVALASSNLSTSTGDEAGTAGGGIISSKTKGKLTFGSSSLDVIVEGKGVVRFMDVTQHNGNAGSHVRRSRHPPIECCDDEVRCPLCRFEAHPRGTHGGKRNGPE
jgi:hypothetical protein